MVNIVVEVCRFSNNSVLTGIGDAGRVGIVM